MPPSPPNIWVAALDSTSTAASSAPKPRTQRSSKGLVSSAPPLPGSSSSSCVHGAARKSAAATRTTAAAASGAARRGRSCGPKSATTTPTRTNIVADAASAPARRCRGLAEPGLRLPGEVEGRRGRGDQPARDARDQRAVAVAGDLHGDVAAEGDAGDDDGHQPELVGIERLIRAEAAIGQDRKRHEGHREEDQRGAELLPRQRLDPAVQPPLGGEQGRRCHRRGRGRRPCRRARRRRRARM